MKNLPLAIFAIFTIIVAALLTSTSGRATELPSRITVNTDVVNTLIIAHCDRQVPEFMESHNLPKTQDNYESLWKSCIRENIQSLNVQK